MSILNTPNPYKSSGGIVIGDTDMDEAVSAIANLKSDLAEAITDRGIETSKDSSFKDLVEDIYKIPTKAMPVTRPYDPWVVYENTRPTDWLPMPTPEDHEIYLLFHILTGLKSPISFTATCGDKADYVVEIGTVKDRKFVPDEKYRMEVKSGDKYINELDADDFGDVTEDGYAQCMIKISANEILTWMPQDHPNYIRSAANRCWNFVEFWAKLPSATQIVIGNSSSMAAALSRLKYVRLIGPNKLRSSDSVFNYCQSLIALLEWDLSNCTTCASMLQNCYSLRAIPKLDTSRITNSSYMFYNCYTLEAVPEMDFSVAIDQSYMFTNNYCLKFVPAANTEKVTNMPGKFNCCYQLTSIGPLNIKKLSSTTNLFGSCYQLQKLLFVPDVEDCNGATIDLKDCVSLSHDALVDLFNSLPTIATEKQLILPYNNLSKTNPISELTEEEIAIATNKGWIVKTSAI